nr:NAD-dependent epimerase/dehydratase family protein [Loktanella sp. Alg231-35]
MFEANTLPDRDKAQIDALCQRIAAIKAKRFVLISTIAVLADFAGQDDEATTAFQEVTAYGRHRRALEAFCSAHFDDCLILRLPALFGAGLKKNFLFDLLNPVPSMLTAAKMDAALVCVAHKEADVLRQVYHLNNENGMFVLDRAALRSSGVQAQIETAWGANELTAVQFTHPETTFQFYGVDRLWRDIETAWAHDIGVLHLATEPLPASEVHQIVTGHPMPSTGARLHNEDMRSLHTAKWGRVGPYLEDASQISSRVAAFLQQQRSLA